MIDGVNRNSTGAAEGALPDKEKAGGQASEPDSASPRRTSVAEERLAAEQRPKSYWRRIAIITPAPNLRGVGFKQYFQRLFHTLRIFTFPAVLYSGLQWGAQDAWLTFYLTVEEDNWYGPPWNYSDAADGVSLLPLSNRCFLLMLRSS